jgi:hypothetical protein
MRELLYLFNEKCALNFLIFHPLDNQLQTNNQLRVEAVHYMFRSSQYYLISFKSLP